MDNRSKEDCIKAIRALLISTKNGLSVREIITDYQKMEGKHLPFKALGFDSVEQLLKESNQFIFSDSKQGCKVTAKTSKNTEHMRNFMQNQKSSSKPKKKTMLMPQRGLRSSTNDQPWNTTAYAKVYNDLPNRSVKKVHPAKLLQATFGSNGTTSFKKANSNSINNGNNSNNTGEAPSLRPILKQSNIKPVACANDSKSYGNGMPTNSRPLTGRTHSNNGHGGQNQMRPNRNLSHSGGAKQSGEKISVQSRLTKKSSTDQIDFVQIKQPPPVKLNPDIKPFVFKTPVLKLENFQNMDPIKAAAYYCTQKGFAEPDYSYSRTKSRNFSCKVTVGMAMYSSYPHEYASMVEAQEQAASIAMQNIYETEFHDQLPICMDSKTEIANKIYDSLEGNGVILKFIPETFQKKYEMTLPHHWKSIIVENPQMFSVVGDSVAEIVYPNIIDDNNPTDVVQKKYCSHELLLPWHENHWNVYITSVSSTVDVWGRLIGADYSTKLDSILDDIEGELLTGKPKQPCTNLAVGKLCYITNEDCRTELHRVRIEKIDKTKNTALCFLIDYGDQEWRQLDQIFDSDSKLFQLPAQAIRFSLYNLEDFAENTHAKREIDEHLAGKTLIAEIKSSESEYTVQCESTDMDAKVKAIFYDTSSDEDIQLNKVILHKICANAEPPCLKRSKWNSVIVTHITDSGDIYCQLNNDKANTIHNIKQLIYRLTQNAIDKQSRIAATTSHDLTSTELYLIYDDSEHKWYRAAILPTQTSNGKTELCKYIDFGMTKTVSREHIYRLDMLSTALSKYPHQAILARLNETKTFNARIVARLRGLLCSSQPVLAQVAGYSANVPLVNICKRLESQESTVLCNINDTIRMELEIENSTDLLPSGDDSFTSISSIKIKDKINTLRSYPEPSLDEFLNAIVVTAPNPSNFFIRPCDEEKKFNIMMVSLRERCNANTKALTTDEIECNQFYAGQSSDGYWYRAKVQKILSDDQLVVYKCDYGSIDLLAANALRPLDSEFTQMPQLAIQAKAHGIQPKNSVWNIEDCARFQERAVGKQFAAKVKAIRKDNNHQYILEIILIDVSKSFDININDELVKEQRAILA